jgi:hypothetical protein
MPLLGFSWLCAASKTVHVSMLADVYRDGQLICGQCFEVIFETNRVVDTLLWVVNKTNQRATISVASVLRHVDD